jgi:hypothetical protein
MFPIILLAALTTAVVYALTGGQNGWKEQSQGLPPGTLKKQLPPGTAVRGASFIGAVAALPPKRVAPLSPEVQRLLSYLVLFARDKPNPPGEKKFLSYAAAMDAIGLAKQLGLPKTAVAIKRDGPVPDDEYIPGRAASVRELVVSYGTTGKA